MPTKKVDDSPVFQLKVTLKHSKPPIWRRIQVRGSVTLYKLHMILQIAMGWTDSHLHQFIAHGLYYGQQEIDYGLDVKSERRAHLSEIVSAVKDRFIYEYDFGDGWEHEVVVEKVLTPEAGAHYPRCLKGKRACPPEDVGGVWGYLGFLEVLQDPTHPEHEDMLDWIGGDFDSEEFDLEAVNEVLKGV